MTELAKLLDRGGRIALVGLLLVSMAGCISMYRRHGYVPTRDELAAIKVGVDTRDTVIEAVGPPSSSGVLDESGFYYVASTVRRRGPIAPKTIERQLVAISFDRSGVVRNIERFSLADGKAVPLESRVTDSSVQNSGFLRQLLGNIGNIDAGSLLNN